MWTAFRGRGKFLNLLLPLIFVDGRISGPGGGRKSAAASWLLFFLRCKGCALPRKAVLQPRKAAKIWR